MGLGERRGRVLILYPKCLHFFGKTVSSHGLSRITGMKRLGKTDKVADLLRVVLPSHGRGRRFKSSPAYQERQEIRK